MLLSRQHTCDYPATSIQSVMNGLPLYDTTASMQWHMSTCVAQIILHEDQQDEQLLLPTKIMKVAKWVTCMMAEPRLVCCG